MTPQEENELLAEWAGLECRCETNFLTTSYSGTPGVGTSEPYRYWGNCPRHSNGGNPPDYDQDEVAILLLNTLADKGYWPQLIYDDDGNWQVAMEGSRILNIITIHSDSDGWQPTIAAAIKRAVLQLIDKPTAS